MRAWRLFGGEKPARARSSRVSDRTGTGTGRHGTGGGAATAPAARHDSSLPPLLTCRRQLSTAPPVAGMRNKRDANQSWKTPHSSNTRRPAAAPGHSWACCVPAPRSGFWELSAETESASAPHRGLISEVFPPSLHRHPSRSRSYSDKFVTNVDST